MDRVADLIERLRASVTYQYMPMNVRKIMSEAATTLETLTQENARLREAGWRDIETLPMDEWVLVYLPEEGNSGTIHAARKMTARHCTIFQVGHHFASDLTPPTHWMPLPPSPARKALGGGGE